MEKTLVQSPEVQNYGQECYIKGYEDGYSRCNSDKRSRESKRKKIRDKKFKKVESYIDKLKD